MAEQTNHPPFQDSTAWGYSWRDRWLQERPQFGPQLNIFNIFVPVSGLALQVEYIAGQLAELIPQQLRQAPRNIDQVHLVLCDTATISIPYSTKRQLLQELRKRKYTGPCTLIERPHKLYELLQGYSQQYPQLVGRSFEMMIVRIK